MIGHLFRLPRKGGKRAEIKYNSRFADIIPYPFLHEKSDKKDFPPQPGGGAKLMDMIGHMGAALKCVNGQAVAKTSCIVTLD